MSTTDGPNVRKLRDPVTVQRRRDPAAKPFKVAPAEADEVARFFELSLDLLCIIGFDGSLRRVSPSCEELFGLTAQELCCCQFLDQVHPDDRDRAQSQLDQLATGTECVRFQNRHLCKDGTTRWLAWTLVPSPESQVAYGLGRDISERELLVRELQQARLESQQCLQQRDSFRASVQKLRTISDSALDAVVMIDQHGKVVHWNPAAERMFGYRQEEIEGAPAHETLVPAKYLERARRGWTDFARTGEGPAVGRVLQLNAVHKNGCEFPIEIAVSPFQVQQQWWATAIIRDVSERVQAEKTMREREIQLLAAQRMQKHLLPDRPPLVPGFDIAGATYPAQFAAGDHYDYLSLPGGYVGVVVSDVSGHGFAPALLVASTQTLLRTLADTRADVSQILTEANTYLANETEDDRFVTVILGGIDTASGIFTYASAGHPTGYVLRASGEIKAELRSTSLPLAVFPDTTVPQADPIQLEPGDTVVLLTDGVIEARSASEKSFGSRQALDVIRAHQDRTSREIIDRLYRAVCEFTGSNRLWDDVTAMIVKVEPRE